MEIQIGGTTYESKPVTRLQLDLYEGWLGEVAKRVELIDAGADKELTQLMALILEGDLLSQLCSTFMAPVGVEWKASDRPKYQRAFSRPDVVMDDLEAVVADFFTRHGSYLWKLRRCFTRAYQVKTGATMEAMNQIQASLSKLADLAGGPTSPASPETPSILNDSTAELPGEILSNGKRPKGKRKG